MKKKIDDMNWRNAFRDVPDECHNAAVSAAYSVQEPEERRRAGFRLHPVLIAVLITIAMTSVAIAAGSLLGWFDFLDQHQSVGIPQTARDAVQTPYQAEWHVGPVRFTVQELLADKQIAVSTTTAALTDGSQALFTDDPYGKIGSSTSGKALAQRLGVAPETTWVEAASLLDLPLYNVRVMFDIMSEYVGGEAMADYMWNEDGSIAYFNLASLNSESIPGELELSFYLSAEQLDPATGRVINRWTDDTHVITVQVGSLELINGRIPDDANQEELISAQAAADQADADVQTAQAAMNKAARSGITDEVYQYTMKRRNLENTMTQAYDSLVVLGTLRESRGLIVAPHDGYILDVHVVEGESWSGATSALTMSAADADCYLRAYVPQNSRTITVGTQVVVTGMESAQIKTQVAATGFDSDGIPIVDVALRTSDIAVLGTPYGLLNNGTRLSINYVASSSTQLIPVSAVRGHGDERYVFTAKMERNSFGQTVYIVEKAPVTVVDETSEYISVSSTDRIGQIIYMEDRAIAEGSTVIPYE